MARSIKTSIIKHDLRMKLGLTIAEYVLADWLLHQQLIHQGIHKKVRVLYPKIKNELGMERHTASPIFAKLHQKGIISVYDDHTSVKKVNPVFINTIYPHLLEAQTV